MNLPINVIKDSLANQSFIQLALSPPRTIVRKLSSKKGIIYQITERKGAQEFHTNHTESSFLDWLSKSEFKQGQLFTQDADYHLFFPNKAIKNPPTLTSTVKDHNRKKNHLLDLAEPPPYFKALSIQKDKFLQIEKFLREVEAILPSFEGQKEIHVVDFGCGKAYLTFALYDFLSQRFKVKMTGLDLKEEVMKNCQVLADKLKFEGLKFVKGSIENSSTDKADLVVALHACDTATDAALEKGVHMGAKVILAAPCCQHELYTQIKSDLFSPLLKHGILRERLASLVTDAARGALLESLGYEVKIVEFIDAEHTPKNLLIRAVYNGKKKPLTAYYALKSALSIHPDFEKRVHTLDT